MSLDFRRSDKPITLDKIDYEAVFPFGSFSLPSLPRSPLEGTMLTPSTMESLHRESLAAQLPCDLGVITSIFHHLNDEYLLGLSQM